MRETIRLRATPTPPHPPFGLYRDPHQGRHTWWAVDSRMLLGMFSLLGSIGAILSVAAR